MSRSQRDQNHLAVPIASLGALCAVALLVWLLFPKSEVESDEGSQIGGSLEGVVSQVRVTQGESVDLLDGSGAMQRVEEVGTQSEGAAGGAWSPRLLSHAGAAVQWTPTHTAVWLKEAAGQVSFSKAGEVVDADPGAPAIVVVREGENRWFFCEGEWGDFESEVVLPRPVVLALKWSPGFAGDCGQGALAVRPVSNLQRINLASLDLDSELVRLFGEAESSPKNRPPGEWRSLSADGEIRRLPIVVPLSGLPMEVFLPQAGAYQGVLSSGSSSVRFADGAPFTAFDGKVIRDLAAQTNLSEESDQFTAVEHTTSELELECFFGTGLRFRLPSPGLAASESKLIRFFLTHEAVENTITRRDTERWGDSPVRDITLSSVQPGDKLLSVSEYVTENELRVFAARVAGLEAGEFRSLGVLPLEPGVVNIHVTLHDVDGALVSPQDYEVLLGKTTIPVTVDWRPEPGRVYLRQIEVPVEGGIEVYGVGPGRLSIGASNFMFLDAEDGARWVLSRGPGLDHDLVRADDDAAWTIDIPISIAEFKR